MATASGDSASLATATPDAASMGGDSSGEDVEASENNDEDDSSASSSVSTATGSSTAPASTSSLTAVMSPDTNSTGNGTMLPNGTIVSANGTGMNGTNNTGGNDTSAGFGLVAPTAEVLVGPALALVGAIGAGLVVFA